MSETARAASRRRVHRVARSSRAHLLVEVVNTLSSPLLRRDVPGSLVYNGAGVVPVLDGATLRHVAAPFHAAFLVVY